MATVFGKAGLVSLGSRADPKRLGKSARKKSTSIIHFTYMTLATSAPTYLLTYPLTPQNSRERLPASVDTHPSMHLFREQSFFFSRTFWRPGGGGGFGSP